MGLEPAYQVGHPWYEQQMGRYEARDASDYGRWASSNMVLARLSALTHGDLRAASAGDVEAFEKINSIRPKVIGEVGDWESFFACAEYILKSDHLNMTYEGKLGFRSVVGLLVKTHPEYAEFMSGFNQRLEDLDLACPHYAPKEAS